MFYNIWNQCSIEQGQWTQPRQTAVSDSIMDTIPTEVDLWPLPCTYILTQTAQNELDKAEISCLTNSGWWLSRLKAGSCGWPWSKPLNSTYLQHLVSHDRSADIHFRICAKAVSVGFNICVFPCMFLSLYPCFTNAEVEIWHRNHPPSIYTNYGQTSGGPPFPARLLVPIHPAKMAAL